MEKETPKIQPQEFTIIQFSKGGGGGRENKRNASKVGD